MTEPTQDAPATDAPDEAAPELSPQERLGLSTDTPSFTIDKSVSVDQLYAELTAAGATSVVFLSTAPDGLDTSADQPMTVYVEGIKTKKAVNDVLSAHKADPLYSATDAQKADAEAIAKVQDPSATPSVEDLAAAVRALLNPAPAQSEVPA